MLFWAANMHVHYKSFLCADVGCRIMTTSMLPGIIHIDGDTGTKNIPVILSLLSLQFTLEISQRSDERRAKRIAISRTFLASLHETFYRS